MPRNDTKRLTNGRFSDLPIDLENRGWGVYDFLKMDISKLSILKKNRKIYCKIHGEIFSEIYSKITGGIFSDFFILRWADKGSISFVLGSLYYYFEADRRGL